MSNDNIIQLHENPIINHDLVEMLDDFLRLARIGDIISGGSIVVHSDGKIGYGYFDIEDQHTIELQNLCYLMHKDLEECIP